MVRKPSGAVDTIECMADGKFDPEQVGDLGLPRVPIESAAAKAAAESVSKSIRAATGPYDELTKSLGMAVAPYQDVSKAIRATVGPHDELAKALRMAVAPYQDVFKSIQPLVTGLDPTFLSVLTPVDFSASLRAAMGPVDLTAAVRVGLPIDATALQTLSQTLGAFASITDQLREPLSVLGAIDSVAGQAFRDASADFDQLEVLEAELYDLDDEDDPRPVLEVIPSPETADADDDGLPDELRALGAESVAVHFRKLVVRMTSDPEAAITSARSLLESVSKVILEQRGADVPPNASLDGLMNKAIASIEPHAKEEPGLRLLVSGMCKVASGTQELRNKRSDSHGGGMDYRPVKSTVGLSVGHSAIVCATVLIRLHLDDLDDDE